MIDRRWPPPKTEQEILDLAFGFQASRALLTACELEVFDVIADKELTAGEIAARIGAEARGVERLLHALCSLGVLTKTGDRFANTDVARRHLVRGEPEHLSLTYLSQKWDNWSLLTEAVRSGHTTVVKPFHDPLGVWLGALTARLRRGFDRLWAVLSRSDRWLRAFVDYMRDHARMRAEAVMEILDLEEVRRVLDVGGGPAVYAMAFADAREEIHVTVFDRPEVVARTRENVAAAGLSDRIDTIGGDFHDAELDSGYDLVFISETVHANSGAENRALIQKAVAALNPGGRIVVQDFILDDNRDGPRFATLFSLDMLIATESGDTYSRADVRGWMTDAGCSHVDEVETGKNTTLAIGHKAKSGVEKGSPAA